MKVGRRIILPVVVLGVLLILPAAMAPISDPPISDPNGPYVGTVGSSIILDGSNSTGDPPLTYKWDFGDGSPVYTESPSSHPDDTYDGMTMHNYSMPNGYVVSLTVTDIDGQNDTATANVTITNQPPICDPNGPYVGNVNHLVMLNGSGSYDPDPFPYDEIVLWEWDMDYDGEFDDATGEFVAWGWNASGTYFVGLRVTDSFVGSDTCDTYVVVGQPPVNDIPEFGAPAVAIASLSVAGFLLFRRRNLPRPNVV